MVERVDPNNIIKPSKEQPPYRLLITAILLFIALMILNSSLLPKLEDIRQLEDEIRPVFDYCGKLYNETRNELNMRCCEACNYLGMKYAYSNEVVSDARIYHNSCYCVKPATNLFKLWEVNINANEKSS